MKPQLKQAAIVVAAFLASALGSQSALGDTGSAAFDRYVQDVRARMKAVQNADAWVSTEVDQGAFQRHLAIMGESAAGPGLNDTAIFLATQNAQPLRTFNTYLAYLGKRMRADAGPPGALLETNKGTAPFDRYVEEINYRIQSLYQADRELGP